MQTSQVIIHRHVFPHISNRLLPGSVQSIASPFPFQAAEEPLYRGIVPVVAFATHTADHAVLP